jgi:hypothetical protein
MGVNMSHVFLFPTPVSNPARVGEILQVNSLALAVFPVETDEAVVDHVLEIGKAVIQILGVLARPWPPVSVVVSQGKKQSTNQRTKL